MTIQLLIICATVLALALLVVLHRTLSASSAAVVAAIEAGAGVSSIDVAPVGARVAVHTSDQRSIRGIVAADGEADLSRDVVVLHSAEYLVEGQGQPLGGIARIPLENVAFTQELL